MMHVEGSERVCYGASVKLWGRRWLALYHRRDRRPIGLHPGSEHRLLFRVRWPMSSIGIDRESPDSMTGHVLVLPSHPNEEKILRTGIEPVTLG